MSAAPKSQAPKISDMVRNNALIVELNCKALGLSRVDKQATGEINRIKHASDDAGKVSASRLPGAKHYIDLVTGIQRETRDMVKRLTCAWGSRRMLPHSNTQKFLNEFYKFDFELQRVMKLITDNKDAILAQAEAGKGDYNVKVPTADELINGWSMSYTLEPVPTAADMSTAFDPTMNHWLQQQFERNIEAAYAEAQADAVERLAKPAKHMVERLAAYSKRQKDIANNLPVGGEGKLYDSVLENMQEIAGVFASFNITNDPVLEKISSMLESFKGLDVKALKEDDATRDDAAKRAQEILDATQGWLGGMR